MNKTIIININGIVFHIEEDAYEALRSYMIDVKKHFGHSADSHEIVGDIENRIAEMFNERIVEGKKEVITMADVNDVIGQMGRVSEFEYSGEEENVGDDGRDPAYRDRTSYGESYTRVPRKLFRDPDDRILGGVSSGLGHYFGIAAPWLRLIFVILFITGGAGLLVYIIMWIVTPLARTRADRMAMRGEAPNLQNFKRKFEEEMEGVRANFTEADGSARTTLRSAGNVIGRIVVVFVKIIAVLFILAICIGIIVLLVAILASFGILAAGSGLAMFPIDTIELGIRDTLLISLMFVASIPLIALIALIIRIVFNQRVIGRYMGFALLATWLIASGISIYHLVATHNDNRVKSILTDEKRLEPSPVYRLGIHDPTKIRLNDTLDREERSAYILRQAGARSFVDAGVRISSYTHIGATMEIQRIDSLEQPTIITEYSARGGSYEAAAERAGKIVHRFAQNGERIVIDNYYGIGENEPLRDQVVKLYLNIPVGTIVYIHKDLARILRRIPLHQCEQHYLARDGYLPEETAWIMTQSGLKCMVEAPVSDGSEL